MHNGVNIRDLNVVEAFWRLDGIRVSHPCLDQALQATGFEKYLPDPPTP